MQDNLLSHLYWISLFAYVAALIFAYSQARKVREIIIGDNVGC